MATELEPYDLQKPEVGSDNDQWGDMINGNIDKINDLLKGDTPVQGIDIVSGSIDGAAIGGTNAAAGTFTTVTATASGEGVTHNIAGLFKGNVVATDGSVVLSNGTDGTDATFSGNAATATTTETARAFSVSGDVATSAGVDFDGSSAVDLDVTITDALWDKIYPEGSIYATTDTDFNPNNSFYGTWVEYAAGKVLVGHDANDTDFDTVNSATHSGSKTHTLTVDQMPSHTHLQNTVPENRTDMLVDSSLATTVTSTRACDVDDNSSTLGTTTHSTGGGQAHNNLQPYIVVKYWHRTA